MYHCKVEILSNNKLIIVACAPCDIIYLFIIRIILIIIFNKRVLLKSIRIEYDYHFLTIIIILYLNIIYISS